MFNDGVGFFWFPQKTKPGSDRVYEKENLTYLLYLSEPLYIPWKLYNS